MWQILFLVIVVLFFMFSFVLLFGAPYLPTLTKQVDTAVELAGLSPGDTILELGCGDGRVLLRAARHGLNAVGYEINPILFLVAYLRTRRYAKQISVIYGNFWNKHWPAADAVYVFLLPRLMPKLEFKVKQESLVKPRVISFAFQFPGIKPKSVKDGVFLYEL